MLFIIPILWVNECMPSELIIYRHNQIAGRKSQTANNVLFLRIYINEKKEIEINKSK